MTIKIVILVGKDQSPEQINKIVERANKLGFSGEDILILRNTEEGIIQVLEEVEKFQENIDDDALFITLADLDTRNQNLVEGISLEQYFTALEKRTGKKNIEGFVTSVESGSALIAHGIDGLDSGIRRYGITLNQNTDFVIGVLDQIKQGRDTYRAFSRAFIADMSAPAPDKKEKKEKKEGKTEVFDHAIASPKPKTGKTKADKSDKFKLQIYKAEQNKETKTEQKSDSLSSSLSLAPPPKPYKAVILIGTDHSEKQIQKLSELLKKQGVLEEEILILGDGKKMMSEVIKEVGKYKGRLIDPVYMTWGHGNNGPHGHFIDDIHTSEIQTELQKQTGKETIKTVITSCFGSGFLKRNEAPEGVSALTRRGSSRVSMVYENIAFIARVAALITKDKTTEETYADALQDEVGSFYFIPAIPPVLDKKKEEKDEAALTEKQKLAKAKEARGIKKINRVGKFSRDFLTELAKSIGGEVGEEFLDKIEKEYKDKTHFGLDKIKSIMGIVTKREENKEGEIEETIIPSKYAKFLLKLREKQQKQVTEENIAKYLEERSLEFFRTAKPKSSRKSLMLDYLIMVAEYGLEEEVMAVLRNDPTLIDMDDDIFTPLMSAASEDKPHIIELLLKISADINKKVVGVSALNQAAFMGSLASVKLLLEKGAKISTGASGSNLDFQSSSYSGNVEIARLLAKQLEPIQSDIEVALNRAMEKGHLNFALYCMTLLPGRLKYRNKDGHSVLQMAAIGGHARFIKQYMELSAKQEGEVYDKNQQKELLKFAISNCSDENFKKLLPLIKPDFIWEQAFIDENFLTRLAKINDIGTIKLLLTKGIDIDKANKDGQTAMMFAAAYGHTELTELLIDQGMGPEEISNRRRIALLFASAHGKIETVKALTAKMTLAQIDELNDHRKDAADVAVEFGHLDILNFLHSKETNPTALRERKINAFFFAYDYHQDHIMQQLIQELGLEIILHTAAKFNRFNVIESILNSNPALNTLENIFTLLAIALDNNATPTARTLVEKMAKDKINTADQHGDTALHTCVRTGNSEIAKLLMEKGIDLSCTNKKGETALGIAVTLNRPDFILLAIQLNPAIKSHPSIFKLLEIAIINNFAPCAKILIESMTKSVASTINDSGFTALHQCAKIGNLEITKLLLAKKVDVTLLNGDGKNALDIALENGHYHLVLEMLKSGKFDWEDFCLRLPKIERELNPEASIAFTKLQEIKKDANTLNELLGKGNLFHKSLSLENLDKIFAIMARNQDNISILDTIGKPQENESILSRCMLHCKTPATIKQLSENLDLLITKQNLFGGDNDNIPARIALRRAFKEPIFDEIVGKLATAMEKAESTFKFDIEFQAEDISAGFRGGKSGKIDRIRGVIKRFSEVEEGDFKTDEKKSKSDGGRDGRVRKKPVKVITGVKLDTSGKPAKTPAS